MMMIREILNKTVNVDIHY